jgi:hypothetical protein
MTARDLVVGVGTFAVVIVVIVGVAAAAGPLVTPQDSPPASADVPSSFEAGSTAVNTSDASGEVDVQADSTGDVVVIDTAHGNDQSTEKVQTLERVLVENGYEVRFHGSGGGSGAGAGLGGSAVGGGFGASEQPSMNESLRSADAYVIVNPSTPYDTDEATSVGAFADAGGRVLIMSDPGSLSALELLAQALGGGTGGTSDSLASVSSQFGVGVGSGYLYNMAEYDGNFQTIYASGADGSLSDGVDRVSVDRAAPVIASPNATVALTTSAETELSESGTAREYAVAARNGNVSIVGDTSILDPARLQHADNEVFVGNLVEFLVSGDVAPDALAPPESSGQFPGPGPGPGMGPGPGPGPGETPPAPQPPNSTASP